MYNPFDDKELHEMIGKRLAKFDPETEMGMDIDLSWWLRFGDMEELTEDTVCVQFHIMESEDWMGSNITGPSPITGEMIDGYNVGWCAFKPDGELLGDCYPCNHSSQVWTQDEEEIWHRAEYALDVLEEFLRTKDLLTP